MRRGRFSVWLQRTLKWSLTLLGSWFTMSISVAGMMNYTQLQFSDCLCDPKLWCTLQPVPFCLADELFHFAFLPGDPTL